MKVFTLHVPVSDDGRTTFSEVADILDHLATLYGWHPDVSAFFLAHANNARQIDQVYELESDTEYISVSDQRPA